MRGNENNLHEPGGTDQEIGQYICNTGLCEARRRPQRSAVHARGTTPGFAVVNFDTSFELGKGLAVVRCGQQRARQGLRQRRPARHHAILACRNGAIGSSGWNYNSSEWQNTTFLGSRRTAGRMDWSELPTT